MWEEGCPLLLDALQVSRNTDSGETYLQSRFQNISNQTIGSFSVELSIEYSSGKKEILHLNPLDADILPGEKYDVKPFELSEGDAVSVQVETTSIKQGLNEWASIHRPAAIPKPSLLSLSAVALEERSIELREMGCKESDRASHCSIGKHGGWTLCPCGQVNVGARNCACCGLDFSAYVPESEDAKVLVAKSEERKKREEAERYEKAVRREATKKTVYKIAAILTGIGMAFFACWQLLVEQPRANAEEAFRTFQQSENPLDINGEKTSDEEWSKKSEDWINDYKAIENGCYAHLSTDKQRSLLRMKAEHDAIDTVFSHASSGLNDPGDSVLVTMTIEEDDSDDSLLSLEIYSLEKKSVGKWHMPRWYKYNMMYKYDLSNRKVTRESMDVVNRTR